MKEMENPNRSFEPTSTRRDMLTGVGTGLIGTALTIFGVEAEKSSGISEKVASAKQDPEAQIPLAGGLTELDVLERQKADIENLKFTGLFFTVMGAIAALGAAANGGLEE